MMRKSSFHLVSLMTCVLLALTLVVSQSNNNLVFELLEEREAGTFVGDVAQASGVMAGIALADVRRLRYQIINPDSTRTPSLFTINASSGSLHAHTVIDREQVCESAVITCQLEVDVTVKLDATVLQIVHIVVIIKDINDNAPTFSNKELHLSISEASPKGSDYSISGAIDRDAQQTTTITYWLEDNLFFGLKEDKLLSVSLLKVVLLQDLDREKQSEHFLLIYARDGHTKSALTGTLSVAITVTDVNDNNPQFAKPAFNFNISEEAEIGSWVGTVDASDLDAGDNGRIAFLFSPLTSNKVRQLFDLDVDTGNVTVKSSLVYESGEIFQAVVIAKDHGESPKASQTILSVGVLDAGNTPPKVSLILAGPMDQNSIILSEDLPVRSFIGRLKYQDNDEGKNGLVDCSSLNHHFDLVPVEDNSVVIEIKTALDRESENELAVVLKCSDLGTPSLSTFVNFTVRVSDANDNIPVFARAVYSGRVKENELTNQNIVQVSATDQDEGVNKDVTYHLSVNTSYSFAVDPFTGWISLIAPVDREADPIFHLTVEAVDKGRPSLTGSVTVNIYVEDANDNAPQITKTEYQVKENEEPGVFVAQIVATDADNGINSELIFQLISDPSASFIVSKNGVITTKQTFDREVLDHYIVMVSVKDTGTPSLTTTSTLTILITDINDHTPQIVYPRPGNDSLSVSVNLSPGTVIAVASATDPDLNKNSQLMYLIVEGNPRHIFAIENSTGAIYLAKRLTSSSDSSYRLTVSVQDSGNPRLHNSTFLYVTVDFNSSTSDKNANMDHKYVIIAGVISGITVIVAVSVLAIILQLRRTDPARRLESAPKLKDTGLVSSTTKVVSETRVNQESKIKISPVDSGFGDNKSQDHDSSTFDSYLFSGSVPVSHRPTLSRDLSEHQHSPQFSSFLQGRQRQTSEDVHSDSSGDATASDSGRGASDAEDISSAVSLNSGASPAIFTAQRYPLNEPAHTTVSSSREHLKPTIPRDSHSLRDLSRAARENTSHNDFDKVGRTFTKVRFSFDDQSTHNPRLDRAQHLYHPQTSTRLQFSNRSIESAQAVPTAERRKQLQGNCRPFCPSKSTSPSQHEVHTERRVGHNLSDQLCSVSSFLISKDALAKHNRLQSGSKQPQLPNKRSLLPPHHSQHLQHNAPLVALNLSVDEEDDDNSTTTSGSYAVDGVEDSLSASGVS